MADGWGSGRLWRLVVLWLRARAAWRVAGSWPFCQVPTRQLLRGAAILPS